MSVAYIKRTASDGRSFITHHLVWDLELFLASQQKQQRDLAKDGKESVTIAVATEAEYRKFAWPKKTTKEKAR